MCPGAENVLGKPIGIMYSGENKIISKFYVGSP